jgi:RNA polymerase sigma-70 factor (ECF subfamily)
MTKEVTIIWSNFHKELRDFIYNKIRNSADTDDILQDVFIKIIRNINKVNKSENMRHYLYGIVRNTINDYFKNQKVFSNTTAIQEQFTETDTISLNETIAECCIKPFIDKLPDNYKQALLITEFQNISQKELAEKLNISYSGAKSRVQRGKDKLKELIINCCAYQNDKYGNLIDTNDKNCACS